MKRSAFFQALLLFMLLAGSWMLLVVRFSNSERAPEAASTQPARTLETERDPPREPGPGTPEPSPAPVPESLPSGPWPERLDRLRATGSPVEMRAALAALREGLMALPPDVAIRQIQTFLESGEDLRTGLAFQVGPGGRLRGAGSLRVLLLDWLHELDPQLAAEKAVTALERSGTTLPQDLYTIHLGNFARGTDLPEAEARRRLARYFDDLLSHEPWLRDPRGAFAEAMDVAVYLGNPDFVPGLVRLVEPGRPQLLRHAAALAIERMVDANPVETLDLLLEADSFPDGLERARAGWFARADPGLPGAPALLKRYLQTPEVSRKEARQFLAAFPNLNLSLSHNLLSTGIPDTSDMDYGGRLRSALGLVRDWLDEPRMDGLSADLKKAEERLLRQLGLASGM